MADNFGRKRSQLWMHFSVVSGVKDKAQCDICRTIISYKGSTSNLKKHLASKHAAVLADVATPKRKRRGTTVTIEKSVSPTSEIEAAATTISDMVADLAVQPMSSNRGVTDPSVTKINNIRNRSTPQKATPSTSDRSASQKAVSITNTRDRSALQKATTTPTTAISSSHTTLSTLLARPPSAVRQKLLNNLVVKMIATDLQPLSMVDDPGFRELIAELNPSYHLPSRTTLARELLPKMYENAVLEVKINVSKAEFVTLTIDEWTSITAEDYIAVTAHYISETWEMRSSLLECFKYDDKHASENLGKELNRIVTDWGIANRLYAIVTDSAASVSAAVQLTGWTHLPCFAHSINLVAQSGVQTIKYIQNKVKAIVEHFHGSTVAADTLRLIQIQMQKDATPLKLKNDIATCWNSTYYMFQRICALQEAVEAALGWLHNPVEAITAEEWIILRELCSIFKPFEQIAMELSKEKDVTLSNVIVMARGLMNALSKLRPALTSEVSLTFLEEMLNLLADRFHQIQYHPVFSQATFLDPRFKKFGFSDNEAVAKVKECVKSDMIKLVGSTEIQRTISGESVIAEEFDQAESSEFGEDSIWEELDKQHRSVKKIMPMSAAIAELRQYSEETNIDRKENPLMWWQSRVHVYPKLAALAKKNLGVVATSVPSEYLFTKTGQIICERRKRIKPSIVQQLIFLNANQNVV